MLRDRVGWKLLGTALLTVALLTILAEPLLVQEDTAPAAQPPAGISLQDDSATDAAIERRPRRILNEIENFDGVAG